MPAYLIIRGRCNYYNDLYFHRREKYHYCTISDKLLKTVDSLGLVTNLISITILILVVRLLVRLTRSGEVEREVINKKNKVNKC